MIEIEETIKAPISTVWDAWTNPKHIINWHFAIPEWHSPAAESDLKVEGKFKIRMEAKDGSMGFDYEGIYTDFAVNKSIASKLSDDRKVNVVFEEITDGTLIKQSFEPDNQAPLDMQEAGWQGILKHFKEYTEKL